MHPSSSSAVLFSDAFLFITARFIMKKEARTPPASFFTRVGCRLLSLAALYLIVYLIG